MNRTSLLCITLVAFICMPAYADADNVALIKNVSGRVDIVRDSGSVVAKVGTTLYVSDRVISDGDATAGVVFRDGTLLTVGPRSDLLVRDYVFKPIEARYAFSVYLAKGSAIYSSGKIGKLAPESVKVGSPVATVGVRGTRFIINAE